MVDGDAFATVCITWEQIEPGRLAPLDAPDLVLQTWPFPMSRQHTGREKDRRSPPGPPTARNPCPGTQRGDLPGRSPVDRGKPGSKIHAVSDRHGLPLTVALSAANVNDSTILEDVLDSLRAIRQPLGRPRRWPGKLHGDKGYDYQSCRKMVRRRGMTARDRPQGHRIRHSPRPAPLRHRTLPGMDQPVPAPGPPLRPQGFPLHRIPAPGLRSDLLPPSQPPQPTDQQQP